MHSKFELICCEIDYFCNYLSKCDAIVTKWGPKLRIYPKKRKNQNENTGPVFAHTYDPRLPPISQIQAKHWRTMVSKNKYLAEVFKRPPLTAYRRQPNLRNLLIRAKVPSQKDNQRVLKGMKKCGNGCGACPYIKEAKNVKINKKNWTINKKLDCNTFNVIYAIICQKENCQMVYIGETKRMLKTRLADHCGYVRNLRTQPQAFILILLVTVFLTSELQQ